MEQCQQCKIKYPDGYLSPMITSEPNLVTSLICGICALDIRNKVHGINNKEFQGEIAEDMRQMAIKYRKENKTNDKI